MIEIIVVQIQNCFRTASEPNDFQLISLKNMNNSFQESKKFRIKSASKKKERRKSSLNVCHKRSNQNRLILSPTIGLKDTFRQNEKHIQEVVFIIKDQKRNEAYF